MQELSRGAEAVIYKDKDAIVKHRIKKNYRIPEIDEELRKQRTRREAKVLEKLQNIIPVPKLLETDSKEKIKMDFISGEMLASCLEKNIPAMKKAGELVAELHNNNIAHGDLTTSNMILNKDVYLIDFGLSFFTGKIEDKAVDIHLLKEALEARHFEIYEEALKAFKQGYKKCKKFKEVMKRLEAVESRGRYKKK